MLVYTGQIDSYYAQLGMPTQPLTPNPNPSLIPNPNPIPDPRPSTNPNP